MTVSAERWKRADALLDAALDLPPAERDGFVVGSCAGDADLEALVRRLLAEADSATAPDLAVAGAGAARDAALASLAATGDGATRATEAAGVAPTPGTRIGRYRVVRELGRGGMAVVYLAERADGAFEQQVALKLIRGTDTDEAVHRFARERQIMALATHPNVARLLDGGATEDGRPYFVMEHVDGVPIDRYCDAHRLTTEERLRLFLAVADAVAYAHRNLVVHRDIKPTNILVATGGVVKLLDFGIARYLGDEDDGLTRPGFRVMTPAYASPEQVSGAPVTTASDIYQLGLLLYRLLAGRLPYRVDPTDHETLVRVVCREPPAPPSAVALRDEAPGGEGDGTSPEEIARLRRVTPVALRRELAGDLDNVVLVALRKEPERRYGSVDLFAEDVRRHLEGLPVRARPDTFAYRAGKFVARNPVAVGLATTSALLLVAFAVAMAVQAARLARARDAAAREAATARHVSDFLLETFKIADPARAQGTTVTARELLDRGAERLRSEVTDEPIVRARMLDTIGLVYQNLGLLDDATPLLDEALALRRAAPGDEAALEVAESLTSVARLRELKGDYAGAEPLYREALALRERLLPAEDARVATSHNNLALLVYRRGDHAGAEALHRRTLALRRAALGDEHTDVADSLSNLGLVRHTLGDLDEAERLYEESLAIRRRLQGAKHPHVAISLDNLGRVAFDRGDLARAETLIGEALALRREVLGDDHPATAESRNNLGALRYRKGDLDGAAAIFREVAEHDRKVLGEQHPDYATSLGNLGVLEMKRGHAAEAEALHRQSVAILVAALGADHPRVAMGRSNLGEALTRLGRHEDARAELVAALERLEEALGAEHARTRATVERLVALAEATGDAAAADRYRTQLAAAAPPPG